MLKAFFAKETGQGIVEYALVIALIAIVVLAAIQTMNGGDFGRRGR